MLMILARLVRSESFWAVVKVRSPHTGPEVCYIIAVPTAACTRVVATSILGSDDAMHPNGGIPGGVEGMDRDANAQGRRHSE